MLKVIHYSNKHKAKDNRLLELHAVFMKERGYDVSIYGIIDEPEEFHGISLLPHPGGFLRGLMLCIHQKASLYVFHDPGLLFMALVLILLRKRVVFDAHENYEEKIKSRLVNKFPAIGILRVPLSKLWWWYEKSCVSLLSGRIAADRTVVKKYGMDTFLLPNYPSKVFFENLPVRNRQDGMFRLVYVGTLTWDRGINETITALGLCRHQDVEFHVIGETGDRKLAALLQNSSKTVWHGRVPWLDLKTHLVNADAGVVLLQPIDAYLYSPGENIVKLWEYMSIGLPVLISDFEGIRKLNDELNFGICVKPDDPVLIAEQIDWMIDHPEESRKLGQNGRSAVMQKYNAEAVTEDMVKYLDRIAKRRRA